LFASHFDARVVAIEPSRGSVPGPGSASGCSRCSGSPEDRMPTLGRVEQSWQPAGLSLEARIPGAHLAARDLSDLADRLEHRAISTLELISDDEFRDGIAALRADARRTPPAPVYSTVDVLVFRLR